MVFWVGVVDILNELNAARIFNGSVAFGYDDDMHVAGDTSCCLDKNKYKISTFIKSTTPNYQITDR